MANTRNRNTQGNYQMEKAESNNWHSRQMYAHSSQGSAYTTYWAGNGLIQGQVRGHNTLLNNALDVEADLLGLGLSLENPRLHAVVSEPKFIPSVDLFSKPSIQMPRTVVPATGARPMYLS